MALREYHLHPRSLILRGEPETIREWKQAIDRLAPPLVTLLPLPPDAPNLPEALAVRQPLEGGVRAWLCEGTQCRPPFQNLDALLEALGDT